MIKKILTWYLMFNKRLLKKTGFLVILIIIPVLAFLLTYYIEKEDSGLLHIALAAEDVNDEFSKKLIDDMNQDSDLLIYTVCENEEQARQMVKTSQVDAAWILTSGMEKKLYETAKGKSHQLIKVYELEENVILKISREKIIGEIFPYISFYTFEDYVHNELPKGKEISKEELEANYRVFANDESIVDFKFLNSSQASIKEAKFLSSPIRGLLIILMLLAGIASTMYFLNDEKMGTYSWLSVNRLYFVLLGNNLAALSISGLFVSVALMLSNVYTKFIQETAAMTLFIIMTALFCSALGAVFKTINSMGILVPTLLVVSIVFCPVFFNTHITGREILPPYFYLYSINDKNYFISMIVYCIIMLPLSYIIFILCRRKTLLA